MRALLVDARSSDSTLLAEAITGAGHSLMATLSSVSGLVRSVLDLGPELLVINVECPGPLLLDALRVLQQERPLPIVLFSQDSDSELIRRAVEVGVSAYVVAGLSAHRLGSVVEVAVARFHQVHGLRRELKQARTDLEERKFIDRAKGLIMAHRQVSENEAYATLRRAAMSSNKRLGVVAKEVINVLGMLQ